ncbi:MAG TPA: galactose-1-phosphate uridylyltransferase, partial [Candidatus Sumerlaeota bacterium]|nr:galactose-1-phosphate uridylyltransferase [Candidatus Sumerlaeota bacterium]
LSRALESPPFNYVLHTRPFSLSPRYKQTTIDEDFHWHIEIMPRLTKIAGFEWGSGFYINPTQPEEAAHVLREAMI